MTEDERKALVDAKEKASRRLEEWTKAHLKFPWTIEEEIECQSLLTDLDFCREVLENFEFYNDTLDKNNKE